MKKLLENLGWIGLALLLAGLVAYSIEDVWTLTAKILAIAGAVVFVAGLIFNFQSVINSFKHRSTLLGFQSLFSVVLFLAILGLINFLSQRHSKRWDLTSQGEFGLSEQTRKVVGALNKDISVKAFFEGGEYRPLKDLLVEYKSLSPRLSYEFIDPNKKPQIAKQYEVKVFGDMPNPMTGTVVKYGTVILETGKRTEKIEKSQEPIREQDLTNALIKVTREGTKAAYFLEGHGEKGPDTQESSGMSKAKAQLEKENFVVKSINLVRETSIPADCSLIIIAGATKAPFPQEMETVKKYLDGGGSLLLLVDPEPSPGFGDFLKDWGVNVGMDVVVDASGMGRLLGAGPEIPLVTEYGTHRITEKFNRIMTFYPLARSVTAASPAPSGVTVEKLFESNPRSWGETGDLKGAVSYDEGKDLKGPVSLAVAVTKSISGALDAQGKEKAGPKQIRMVVVGDSDFASNAYFGAQGNGNLFMNMANWLAADEDLVSIRPKDPQDKRVTLSVSQQRTIFYCSVIALPLIILVTGVTVWFRRKRL
jgi:ABC-type uncharacterized transport system involved in gliding motility auxiliary subunit